MKKWIALLLSLMLLLTLAACGANKAATDSVQYSNGSMAESAETPMSPANGAMGEPQLPQGRKWIVTISMRAETEDLTAMMEQVTVRVSEFGGYLEDTSIYNGSAYAGERYRNANLTIRIPADQADKFTHQVGEFSNVVSNSKSQEDITLTYVSTDSRMKALQTEEARLLELMAQAENMSDLLQIESRLTDVRYELERVTSQLRVYDNQVDYATIHLNIEEVKEYTPTKEKTLWQRISGGFVDSIRGVGNLLLNLLVLLTVALPYLVVLGGLMALGVWIILRLDKKRRQKKAKKEAQS